MTYSYSLPCHDYKKISNEISNYLHEYHSDIFLPMSDNFVVHRFNQHLDDFLDYSVCLKKFLRENNLTVKTMAFLKIVGVSSIHIDGAQHQYYINSKTPRLQWAIQNCHDSKTIIYKFKEYFKIPNFSTKSIYADGSLRTFMHIKDEHCTEVDSFLLEKQPVIWWPNRDPHRVSSSHNDIRISATFGLVNTIYNVQRPPPIGN